MSITLRQAAQFTHVQPPYLDLLRTPHWFRINMPYLIERIGDDGKLWLPLNREYKPLGRPRSEFVRYEDEIANAMVFRRDPRKFDGIFINHDPRAPKDLARDRMWLYSDSPASRQDYFARLGRLLSYDVRVPEDEIHQKPYASLPGQSDD